VPASIGVRGDLIVPSLALSPMLPDFAQQQPAASSGANEDYLDKAVDQGLTKAGHGQSE
jgi:hypothetical protein